MKPPYIGITGFTSRQEVEQVVQGYANEPDKIRRRLMIGVLASTKTLDGGEGYFPKRYPKAEDIADIFIKDNDLFNVVHFSCAKKAVLYDQLLLLQKLAGNNCHGVQLNMAWPDIGQLRRFKEKAPWYRLILQCGEAALDSVQHVPKLLAAKVKEYEGVCDYVLLDPSGGKGLSFDEEKTFNYLAQLHHDIFDMNFAISGGLCEATLPAAGDLIKIFPYISIDGEGQLRSGDGDDRLVIEKAISYRQKAEALFRLCEPPGMPLGFEHPYDLKSHLVECGNGRNTLRMKSYAQPRSLCPGDILATGCVVLSPPRDGGNGSVLLHLSGGYFGHWIKVAARIPVALLEGTDEIAMQLRRKAAKWTYRLR